MLFVLTGVPVEAHKSEESHQAAAGSTLSELLFCKYKVSYCELTFPACSFYSLTI